MAKRFAGLVGVVLFGVAAGWSQQSQQLKRPPITGIAFTRFFTSDPAAAKAFYGGRLGLVETDGPAGLMTFAVGMRQRIEVLPLPSPAPNSRLAEVGFLTPDLPAMKTYLERHGLQVQDEGSDTIRTSDPEGNQVAFVREARAAAGKTTGMLPAGKAGSPTSRRIIHAGWKVESREAEDAFYIKLLGFRPYWYGGPKDDGGVEWVSQQVPDGTDWIEYMLGGGATPDARTLGVLDHVSLGVARIESAGDQLQANGMDDPSKRKIQMGRDGKMQLNVFDPDLTRVEFMEFQPRQKSCCSEPTAKAPTSDTE